MREQTNSTQTHLQTKIDFTHAQNVTWWWPFIGKKMVVQQEKIMAVQSNYLLEVSTCFFLGGWRKILKVKLLAASPLFQ